MRQLTRDIKMSSLLTLLDLKKILRKGIIIPFPYLFHWLPLVNRFTRSKASKHIGAIEYEFSENTDALTATKVNKSNFAK